MRQPHPHLAEGRIPKGLGTAPIACAYFANFSCQYNMQGSSCTSDCSKRPQRPAWPVRQETALDSAPRSPNGFLSSLTADDFELIRPHLRATDLSPDMALVEVDETLKRAYLPHKGVISLVVKLARGEHVQVAMIGRDSIFGAFSALGDAVALNSAVVLVPGIASTIDLDQLRIAADQSTTLRAELVRHGLAVYAQIQQTA